MIIAVLVLATLAPAESEEHVQGYYDYQVYDPDYQDYVPHPRAKRGLLPNDYYYIKSVEEQPQYYGQVDYQRAKRDLLDLPNVADGAHQQYTDPEGDVYGERRLLPEQPA